MNCEASLTVAKPEVDWVDSVDEMWFDVDRRSTMKAIVPDSDTTTNTDNVSTVFPKRSGEEYSGGWFRASSYCTRLGRIHAGNDAVIERYNPWEGFVLPGSGTRGGRMLERPYLSLIELSDAFERADLTRGGFAHLDPEMFPLVESWYQKHGCLGLFFSKARQVNLYPRWKQMAGSNGPSSRYFPTFTRHVRTPTGWKTQSEHVLVNANIATVSIDEADRGLTVPKELWNPEWKPGVLIQEGNGFSWVEIEKFMRDFFPTIPPGQEQETYDYPGPFSVEFWKLYGESIGEFVSEIQSFSRAVRSLARFRPIEEMNDGEKHFLAVAYHELMNLASQVNPALLLKVDGTCSREWVSTSLLSSYAMMVLLDAERGALNVCVNCSRVFASSAGRARFCSSRCRRTQLQRQSRARRSSDSDAHL